MPAVLYSFRRCPYAMRARLALAAAGAAVELREVALAAKPAEMLVVSPKGTVPVLQLEDGTVLEESLDIMHWALARSDPGRWLELCRPDAAEILVAGNDGEFKYWLDRYKYADRYPDGDRTAYRQHAEAFLAGLEARLAADGYLCGGRFSWVDAAILPFVRQFAAVDAAWFAESPYPAVRAWLQRFAASLLFAGIMAGYPVWQPGTPGAPFAERPADLAGL